MMKITQWLANRKKARAQASEQARRAAGRFPPLEFKPFALSLQAEEPDFSLQAQREELNSHFRATYSYISEAFEEHKKTVTRDG